MKRQYEENIAAESKYIAKMCYKYINNKKHIRSGIGPLTDNDDNLVTDNQRKAKMLNKYFSSVFNITSDSDNTTWGTATPFRRQHLHHDTVLDIRARTDWYKKKCSARDGENIKSINTCLVLDLVLFC